LEGIQEVILNNNQFSGPIPNNLKSFLSLKKMDLSYNQLSGEIPQEIGALFRLEYL
ncbi:hypothetical protein MKW92_011871, partial [Papaver armeniacum]